MHSDPSSYLYGLQFGADVIVLALWCFLRILLHVFLLDFMIMISRESKSRRQTVPEKGHQEAKSNVDHDGHVDVPHVVLIHMSISRS